MTELSARFDVEVTGEDLGRARAALDAAGIPTTSNASGLEGSSKRPAPGRRFLRSGAFSILVVIALAFLAQRLISPAEEMSGSTYDRFLNQVERAPETIERVTLETESTEIEVVERDGDEYTTGYPPSTEESLVNSLRRQEIETVVEGSDGGSVLSVIFYVLPFLLFFGFWLYLSKRMDRGGTPGAWGPGDLKAVVDAESPEAAERLVRNNLPRDAGYQVRSARRW